MTFPISFFANYRKMPHPVSFHAKCILVHINHSCFILCKTQTMTTFTGSFLAKYIYYNNPCSMLFLFFAKHRNKDIHCFIPCYSEIITVPFLVKPTNQTLTLSNFFFNSVQKNGNFSFNFAYTEEK